MADSRDAVVTEHQLLRDFSKTKSYTAGRLGNVYPGIRVFFRPHPKASELPKDPAPLPLLVFVHGLGGSISQFHPLLSSLVNSASCLAVDLPGCGLSEFSPTQWSAYTTEALVDLLETIIDEHRAENQGVVFIAHSMGTVISARLANRKTTHRTRLAEYAMGLVAICPFSGPMPESKVRAARVLLWIPETIFNLWRAWDRWGGPESNSAKRFCGPDADLETRQLQDAFNSQSRTPVFRRMAYGTLPDYAGSRASGLFDEPSWDGLDIPVFLIGGQHDVVTPPAALKKVEKILKGEPGEDQSTPNDSQDLNLDKSNVHVKVDEAASDAAVPIIDTVKPQRARRSPPPPIEAISNEEFEQRRQNEPDEETYEDPTTPRDHESTDKVPLQPQHPVKVVKSIILPAGHSVPYSKSARIMAGLIGDFLNDHITGRFSLGWQLQHLSREGKWDVKNLAKWKSVQPVSEPIGGIFRAMKTLREVDDEHCPQIFTKKWGDIIKDIVDISHDNPVYDPRSFSNGIKYHKLPTVSKIPPTETEVANFIKMVDEIREDQKVRSEAEPGWSSEYVVGVHCHYGFNRTGYFLVCYLVERCGYGVQEAIGAFAAGRPNGIRHSHFIDQLALRYSGLDSKK